MRGDVPPRRRRAVGEVAVRVAAADPLLAGARPVGVAEPERFDDPPGDLLADRAAR